MIEYEEMALNAWPALRNFIYKGCLLRSSNGYTNRANSANPLYTRKDDFEEVVTAAEGFYCALKRPGVFKILETGRYEYFDKLLQEIGYEQISKTTVMKCDLSVVNAPNTLEAKIESSFSDDWFDSFVTLNQIKQEFIETARRMLSLIPVDIIACSIAENNKIVACGYGALENGHVGCFDIVVEEKSRGRGLGKALMKAILNESKRRGIHTSYLQVMDNNERARNLYQGLGFKGLYKYWYRKKEE